MTLEIRRIKLASKLCALMRDEPMKTCGIQAANNKTIQTRATPVANSAR